MVLAKLHHGEWRSWPQVEQEPVQGFLLALWRAVLEEPPGSDLLSEPEVESWLCALAQTGGDLSLYLNDWLQHSSSGAVWNLAAAIYRTGLRQANLHGISAFWQGHMDQAKQVSEWLHSKAVRNKLESALEISVNEPFAEELMAAVGVVRG